MKPSISDLMESSETRLLVVCKRINVMSLSGISRRTARLCPSGDQAGVENLPLAPVRLVRPVPSALMT